MNILSLKKRGYFFQNITQNFIRFNDCGVNLSIRNLYILIDPTYYSRPDLFTITPRMDMSWLVYLNYYSNSPILCIFNNLFTSLIVYTQFEEYDPPFIRSGYILDSNGYDSSSIICQCSTFILEYINPLIVLVIKSKLK